MEAQFWNERWRSGETGFHQAHFHDLLTKHWPSLRLASDSAVFVPLCGKSLDMVWLAEQGHRVVGSELSEIAVDAFFAERGFEPSVEEVDGFVVKRAGAYEIWQGDFFALPKGATARADAIYDRAALVAFPKAMQGRYATKLAQLAPAQAPIFLISLDFDQNEMAGPPFATGLQQVASCFAPTYAITLVETRDGLEEGDNLRQRGLTSLKETVYVLKRS